VKRVATAVAALLLAPGGALACNEAAPEQGRPDVMLMTGLPLVWGEKGPFEPGSKPAAAYAELSGEFDFRPVDVLDEPTLARGRLLFLAQPKRLAPAELVALDGWIRSGGRALILTDPMLTWPSELPLGDIRRPPPAGLLGPLLDHWRVRMAAPAEPREVLVHWNGRRLRLDSPGRLQSANPDCIVSAEEWTAFCRLGRGTVRVVADADLMRDSVWTAGDNEAVVAGWLDELAGISRPRPNRAEWSLWLALALALVGITYLLRRGR
jgi:hypothetical protein